jgi:hypothetical protein
MTSLGTAMSDTAVQSVDVASLPLPPRNPLPYWQRRRALRVLHTGQEALRDSGGPVTSVGLGPKLLVTPVVLITRRQESATSWAAPKRSSKR